MTDQETCAACAGTCCSLRVDVTERDIERLEAAGLSRMDFLDEMSVGPFADAVAKNRLGLGLGASHMRGGDDGSCVLLTRDEFGRGRCSAYEHRPEVCRAYTLTRCESTRQLVSVTKKSTA